MGRDFRFVATIKLKEAAASPLFKRLNSYARQHPLYSALREFGKLPKSDFLLRWIDDVTLRQAVEKQLNKIENSNITGCEFSAAQELLVVATEEGKSSIREWCGQKNAEDSGHSLAQNAGDRRVFWLGRSCCTARAWSSFLPLLQEVSSLYKTRNQLH